MLVLQTDGQTDGWMTLFWNIFVILIPIAYNTPWLLETQTVSKTIYLHRKLWDIMTSNKLLFCHKRIFSIHNQILWPFTFYFQTCCILFVFFYFSMFIEINLLKNIKRYYFYNKNLFKTYVENKFCITSHEDLISSMNNNKYMRVFVSSIRYHVRLQLLKLKLSR